MYFKRVDNRSETKKNKDDGLNDPNKRLGSGSNCSVSSSLGFRFFFLVKFSFVFDIAANRSKKKYLMTDKYLLNIGN